EDAAAPAHRRADRVRRPLPGAAAGVHLPGNGVRPRRAAGDADGPGAVPDGDDLHLGTGRRRRDLHDLAQPRRARRFRENPGSLRRRGDAPGQRQGPGQAEVDTRSLLTGGRPRYRDGSRRRRPPDLSASSCWSVARETYPTMTGTWPARPRSTTATFVAGRKAIVTQPP